MHANRQEDLHSHDCPCICSLPYKPARACLHSTWCCSVTTCWLSSTPNLPTMSSCQPHCGCLAHNHVICIQQQPHVCLCARTWEPASPSDTLCCADATAAGFASTNHSPTIRLSAATVWNAALHPSMPAKECPPMLVANTPPSMPPKLAVSCRVPNALPRCSAGYKSAIRLWQQGTSRASPTPLSAANIIACRIQTGAA